MRYQAVSREDWHGWDDAKDVRGKRVYLAGPMTGLPGYNYSAFNVAAGMLRHAGIPVHNPAEQHGGRTDLPREVYMHDALAAVLQSSAVVLLGGWEESSGVGLELVTASAAGIPAYRFVDFMACLEGGAEPVEVDVTTEHRAASCGPTCNPAPSPVPPRAEILAEAAQLITGDRNNTYGPPTADFARTAGMLTALGFQHDGSPIEPHHVAMIIACVKLSRLTWSPDKRDNWVDLAGYAGCGYECVVEEGT